VREWRGFEDQTWEFRIADRGFPGTRLTCQGRGQYDDGRVVQNEGMGLALLCTLGARNGYGGSECVGEHREREPHIEECPGLQRKYGVAINSTGCQRGRTTTPARHDWKAEMTMLSIHYRPTLLCNCY